MLVVIDAFTKYVRLCALKRRTADCTIKAMRKVFENTGIPIRIIADRALAFTSTSFKAFMKENNVELHFIATGMPRGNGQVERAMRTIFNMLRATLIEKDERNWTRELPKLEDNLNLILRVVQPE